MKEKQWIFFRVMVYMCLAGAGLGLFVLIYFASSELRSLRSMETIVILFFVALTLQALFNIMNIRLIHYHLSNKVLPEQHFRTWHTVLIVINSCIALAFICLFGFGFIESLESVQRRGYMDSGDITALLIIGAYTFVSVCAVTGSIRLRSYIYKYTVTREDEWLNQLGS